MDSLLLLQILAPIFITAAFAAMGWLFLRSVSAELSQFQKLLLLYGCVFVFGSGYIADPALPLLGWIVWLCHLAQIHPMKPVSSTKTCTTI
jgi:hypothetical protein